MTVSATLISAVGFNNSNFTRYLTASLLTYVPGTSTTIYGYVTGNQVISWNFPTFATAYSAASLVPSSIYQSGVTATVASISTLYFAFSATTYNDTTTSYTLCSLPINCTFASNVTSYTSPTGYNQIFDTFPNINLAAYINYESTNNSPFFYRLTSTNSFPVTAYFTSPSFSNGLTSVASYVPDLSTNLYGTVGTINNVLTAFNNLTAVQNFNRSLVGISSVGIILTAVSGTNSFAPWYTPHTFNQNLSVSFVPYYLSAGFIGFPDTVFSGSNVQPVNSSNYTSPSATLTFLGEGHTANITLSAINDSHATSYSWNVKDNTLHTGLISLSTLTTQTSAATSVKGYYFNTIFQYVSTLGVPASSSIITSVSASDGDNATNTWTVTYSGYPNNFSNTILTRYSTITASVSTTPANSNIIPITLQLCDNKYFALSSNPPIIQYDDSTGKPFYYPFYSSTLDTFNNEATATNNVFHQSVQVTTYDVSSFVLYPNVPNTFPSSVIPSNNQIYLPVPPQPFTNNSFGTPTLYNSLLTNISSINTLPCYDTAGGNLSGSLFWTWAALSSTALNNLNNAPYPLSSQSVIPSSWSMTQCLSSVAWNGTNINTLSTVTSGTSGMFAKTWGYQGAGIISLISPVTLSATSGITWSLITNNWVYPTISYTNNATQNFNWTLQLSGAGTATTNTGGTLPLYQNTPVTIQAQQTITASVTGSNTNINYDWQPRDIIITPSVTLTSIGLPRPLLYTPNRYVLTGANIPLQNVSTNSNFITAVNLNFNNTLYSNTTGNPYNNIFIASSNLVGYKNVTLTTYTNYPNLPIITSSFPNIVDIVTQYDDVQPLEYRSLNSSINLPYPTVPKVGANDWAIDDNINSCIEKIYNNLQYLNILGKTYFSNYSDYFGYLCPVNYSTIITNTIVNSSTNIAYCPHWTWENLNTAITPSNNITWFNLSGTNVPCGTWLNQTCSFNNATPIVTTATTSTTATTLTSIQGTLFCNAGNWNVNIPGLDVNYGSVNNGNYVNPNCIYTGIVSKNNNLYTAQSTQINLLSSDYLSTVYAVRNTTDGKKSFSSIVNMCLDSSGKIFVLDSNLSQVITLVSDTNNNWYEFNNWGGFGFVSSKFKFNMPEDIHVDQLDNVWVCDTGNNAIKQYTNTGSWLLTINDNNLASYPPLSLAVDSKQNVHVLTTGGIFVYSYSGVYQYTYGYNTYASSTNPRRINTSYNREIIYVAFDTQVLKFFRTGTFNGYIIQSLANVTNINSLYQDEFRNLLIVSDNIILKFPDIMQLTTRQSSLPIQYWTLNDLLIHKEEYVQNWVYNKSFERLWDNIEMFRNTLQYSNGNCLSYTAPIHSKSKMIIGQNEIVTSTTVNRVLGYLWDNFYTLVKFFDPNCNN